MSIFRIVDLSQEMMAANAGLDDLHTTTTAVTPKLQDSTATLASVYHFLSALESDGKPWSKRFGRGNSHVKRRLHHGYCCRPWRV